MSIISALSEYDAGACVDFSRSDGSSVCWRGLGEFELVVLPGVSTALFIGVRLFCYAEVGLLKGSYRPIPAGANQDWNVRFAESYHLSARLYT